jgi:acetyl esterase/lipase
MRDWATPSTSWASVDAAQREIDKLSAAVLELPIAELRQIGYRAPPLPLDVPEPGREIDISTIEVAVRDGTKVPLRIYKRIVADADSPLFFNIHGGGNT